MKSVVLIATVALSLSCVMAAGTTGYADDNYTVSSGTQAATKKQDLQKPSRKNKTTKTSDMLKECLDGCATENAWGVERCDNTYDPSSPTATQEQKECLNAVRKEYDVCKKGCKNNFGS